MSVNLIQCDFGGEKNNGRKQTFEWLINWKQVVIFVKGHYLIKKKEIGLIALH